MRQACAAIAVIVCGAGLFARPASAQPFVYGSGIFCMGGAVQQCFTRVQLVNVATHQTTALGDVGGEASVGRLVPAGDRLLLAMSHTLVVVDTRRGVAIASIAVSPATIDDIAVTPGSLRAYLSSATQNSVTVVDLNTNTVSGSIAVPGGPTRMKASPDGGSVFVVANTGNAVARIATATSTVAATIAVGTSPTALDISPDGTRLFVGNRGGH